MILVDTSIWIDHLRQAEPKIAALMRARGLLSHPFVIGELSMGSLKDRDEVIRRLRQLPQAAVARELEVQAFVTRHHLFGLGIGYIDAHLLVSVQLSPGTLLWTRDRRLHWAAERMGLALTEGQTRPN